MNLLELAVEEDKDEQNHMFILMKIDGNDFLSILGKDLNSVFFTELLASSKKPGDYLIFTCSCGIADCGGWERVNVIHNENSIKWNFNYNEIDYQFEFETLYYKGEIERIEFELKKLAENVVLDPKHVMYPE